MIFRVLQNQRWGSTCLSCPAAGQALALGPPHAGAGLRQAVCPPCPRQRTAWLWKLSWTHNKTQRSHALCGSSVCKKKRHGATSIKLANTNGSTTASRTSFFPPLACCLHVVRPRL